jgi:hypothetical protein
MHEMGADYVAIDALSWIKPRFRIFGDMTAELPR